MNERPMDDDWIFDPSLAAINRSIHREFREEAEEIEAIVNESELRARRIADVAREHRNRGDFVTLATPHRDFSGYIVYAAGDFVTLSFEDLEVDVALAHISFFKVMPSMNQRSRAGKAGTDGPGTFEMRLVERISPRERIEIGFALRSESLYGHMTATGQDHIIIVDEQHNEWVIPYSAIAFVARGGPKRLR